MAGFVDIFRRVKGWWSSPAAAVLQASDQNIAFLPIRDRVQVAPITDRVQGAPLTDRVISAKIKERAKTVPAKKRVQL